MREVMRKVDIESFLSYEDALDWVDSLLWNYNEEYDIKIEIVLIDGIWRASIMADTRQGELFD